MAAVGTVCQLTALDQEGEDAAEAEDVPQAEQGTENDCARIVSGLPGAIARARRSTLQQVLSIAKLTRHYPVDPARGSQGMGHHPPHPFPCQHVCCCHRTKLSRAAARPPKTPGKRRLHPVRCVYVCVGTHRGYVVPACMRQQVIRASFGNSQRFSVGDHPPRHTHIQIQIG